MGDPENYYGISRREKVIKMRPKVQDGRRMKVSTGTRFLKWGPKYRMAGG